MFKDVIADGFRAHLENIEKYLRQKYGRMFNVCAAMMTLRARGGTTGTTVTRQIFTIRMRMVGRGSFNS